MKTMNVKSLLPAAVLASALGLTGTAWAAPFAVDNRLAEDKAVALAAKDLARVLGEAEGRVSLVTDARLADQEWRVRRTGRGEIEIAGANGMGVVYGVYSFLEGALGCRWYAPDCEVIASDAATRFAAVAQKPDAAVVATGRPAILYREMYVGRVPEPQARPLQVWRLRNRESRRAAYNCELLPGSPRECHSFADYAAYLREHGGKFCGKHFCLTDETNRRLVAERMLEYIRADRLRWVNEPDYRLPRIYDLSQDDGGEGFDCDCEGCRGLCRAAGSWSGPNIAFADAVARKVAAVFPDVKVRTFAYSYTERAPTNDVVASDSLVIRYCRSFLFQPLTAGTDNGRFLEAWSPHVRHKQVWGYWRSFSGPHVPSVKPLDEIGEEMRFCRSQGVCGYFAEAEDPQERSFSELQHWLFLKTSESPDLDVRRIAEEFCAAYYGPAAAPLLRLYDAIAASQREAFAKIDPGFVRSLRSGNLAMYTQRGYLTKELFATAEALLAEAKAAVGGDAVRAKRVEKEREVFARARADRFEKKACPAELAGRDYEEWQAKSLREGPGVVVEDPESVSGFAVTCDKVTHRLPYVCGVYDPIAKKTVEMKLAADQIPQDEKYHLYRLGRCPLICESRVYYVWSWDWTTWLPAFTPAHDAREIWLSVKLTGPTYVKGSKKKDGIFVERMFVLPCEGAEEGKRP